MDFRSIARLRQVSSSLLLTTGSLGCRGENRSSGHDEDDHLGYVESDPSGYGEPDLVRLPLMDDGVRTEANGLSAMWDLMVPDGVSTEPDHTLLYPEGQAGTGYESGDSGELTCVRSLEESMRYELWPGLEANVEVQEGRPAGADERGTG